MKIVYLCSDHGIPILGAKGASVHVREFARALMYEGHAVSLVCAKQGRGNPIGCLTMTEIAPEADAAQLEAVCSNLRAQNPALLPRQSPPPGAAQLLDKELKKWAYNAQLEPALDGIIADERPDALIERYSLFSDAGTRIARKHQLPHLLEVNAPLIQERRAWPGMVLVDLAQQIEDQVLSAADAVITVSGALSEYVIGRGAAPARVTVIPNGVDLDKFNPAIGLNERKAARLECLGLAPELEHKTVIGFVGSLKPWHGVDLLVRAFAQARRLNPRLFLLIVGEGPQLENCMDEARALSVSGDVCFTGAVPHHLIPQYLALMDITVAPYRQQECFYFSPLKILEYMAMGKLVIASRQGQISELIEHERTGLLCESESVESLSEALSRSAHDPDLRKRLGQQAAASVAQNHSWSQVARRVVALAGGRMPETARISMPGLLSSTVALSQRIP